jgi:hypothetical protein
VFLELPQSFENKYVSGPRKEKQADTGNTSSDYGAVKEVSMYQ